MVAMRRDRPGVRFVVPLLVLAVASGCAGGPGAVALDSGDSWCDAQYRESRQGAPAPSGLSERERSRYEDRARDYHVSRGCQQEATRTVRHEFPDVPLPRLRVQ